MFLVYGHVDILWTYQEAKIKNKNNTFGLIGLL